jgi:hypothetical protein
MRWIMLMPVAFLAVLLAGGGTRELAQTSNPDLAKANPEGLRAGFRFAATFLFPR